MLPWSLCVIVMGEKNLFFVTNFNIESLSLFLLSEDSLNVEFDIIKVCKLFKQSSINLLTDSRGY